MIATLYEQHNDIVGNRAFEFDASWVVRSKKLAESVNGRCQRLACYVPMSGGERQIRHFSSAFILMYTVSFIIYMIV